MNTRLMNITTTLMVVAGLSFSAWAQGRGMGRGGEQMKDMQTIHALFGDHQKISRTVKKIERGVETVTESDDPKVQALIHEHVAAMYQRLAKQQPIRQWDPLFAELFKHANKIKMELVKTPKGIKVIETSVDDYVVKLIQAHAEGVSEFVKEGMPSMHKSHPLPGAQSETKGFLGKGDGVETCPVTGEPVNKDIKWGFYGRTVYFCCESCRDAVKKNPELYLKP
jgi:YHS domain-containing protein